MYDGARVRLDEREKEWAVLMRAGNAGDSAAYRRLLAQLTAALRAFAGRGLARAGASGADAEDIVQETLLALHLKRQTWDGGAKLAPWVNAIARHKIIDAMRRRGARRLEPIEDFEAVLAAPEAEDPHTRSDVERLLEQLNPRARDIVKSISLDGKSITETAIMVE